MSRVWCLSRFSPLIPVASLFYSSTYSTTRDWFLHLWQEQGMCGRTSVQNPGNVFDQIIMCMPVLTATSIRKNKNAGIPHAVALCRYWFFCFFFSPTNRRFMATLHGTSPSAPFFQQHRLTSCLCVTFGLLSQLLTLLHYYSYGGGLGSVIFNVTRTRPCTG